MVLRTAVDFHNLSRKPAECPPGVEDTTPLSRRRCGPCSRVLSQRSVCHLPNAPFPCSCERGVSLSLLSVNLFDEGKAPQAIALPVCSAHRDRAGLCSPLRHALSAVVMDDELAATQLFTTKTASLFLLSLWAAWGTRMCFSLLGPFCHVSSCWGSLQWDYRLFLLS